MKLGSSLFVSTDTEVSILMTREGADRKTLIRVT